MGVLNVTPDSFSDGGRYIDPDVAIDHGLRMVAEGADLIDVGGESTRPGARPVTVEDELARVVEVIAGLSAHSNVPISVDTRNARVAEAALEAGADIVNDISALTHDQRMAEVAAASNAGVVLMHMRGDPQTMQQGDLRSTDIVRDILRHLRSRIEFAVKAGIGRERICVDPGFGFGKTVDQNYEILLRLGDLGTLERPVLAGVSRKSFIGAATGRRPAERLMGTASACACAVLAGVDVLRVHDVGPIRDAVRVAERVRSARK